MIPNGISKWASLLPMTIKENNPYRIRLSRKLKTLGKGMTQREFSRKVGLQQATLNRYLNRERSASLDHIHRICERLKIDIVELFSETPDKEKEK